MLSSEEGASSSANQSKDYRTRLFPKACSSRQARIGALVTDDTLSTLPPTLPYEYNHAVHTISRGQHAAPAASLASALPRRPDDEELPDQLEENGSTGEHRPEGNMSTSTY